MGPFEMLIVGLEASPLEEASFSIGASFACSGLLSILAVVSKFGVLSFPGLCGAGI